MELVVDGQIIYENLRKMGKTGRWLMEELKKRKVKSLRDVFYVSLESDGSLYVDRRRDLLTNTVPGRRECNFPGRCNLTPEKEGTRQWLS